MTETMTSRKTSGAIDSITGAVNQLRAIHSLLSTTLWHEQTLLPRDQVDGLSTILDSGLDQIRDAASSLEEVDTRPATGVAPADRRGAVRLLIDSVDTSLICERYALPVETFRDMLIAMADAPLKVKPASRSMGKSLDVSALMREERLKREAGDETLDTRKVSNSGGPIVDGLRDHPDEVDAMQQAARFAADFAASVDPEQIARDLNLKRATVDRVIAKLLGTEKTSGDEDDAAGTGTDG